MNFSPLIRIKLINHTKSESKKYIYPYVAQTQHKYWKVSFKTCHFLQYSFLVKQVLSSNIHTVCSMFITETSSRALDKYVS